MDKWTMFVERWPGCSSMEEANSADRLKTLASDLWKGASSWGVSKMRFTIFDPADQRWQTCERTSGGSWRARWEWCDVPSHGALLKGEG